jgi:hypothetical protein
MRPHEHGGRGAAILLWTVALFPPGIGSADRIPRQTLATGGGTSTGTGKRLEMTAGQVAGGVSGTARRIFTGYLNTNHAPGTATDLSAAAGAGEGEANLSWTSPGADGPLGQAADIIVKVSASPILDQALFEAARTYAVLTPLPAGGFESRVATGLPAGPGYYFAIEARDAAGNQAELSNAALTGTADVPPADVTDLAAEAGAAAGSVLLSWTSPGDDGSVGDLDPGEYRVGHSTDPSHAFAAADYQIRIATLAAAGSRQNRLATGLPGNAAVHFRLFTGDDVPVFSGPSNAATAVTRTYPPSALPYGPVGSAEFTANWSPNGNRAGTEFFVEVTAPPGVFAAPVTAGWTSSTQAVFSRLSPGVTYHARVRARSAALEETESVDLGPVFLSAGLAAPLGLAVEPGDGLLRLSWNPVLSGDPVDVNIYRSTAPAGPFVRVVRRPVAQTSDTDDGLVNGQAYYYRLTSAAGSDESAPSGVVSGTPRDPMRPQGVAGLRGASLDGAFEVRWQATRFSEDGTPLTDLKSYHVYRVIDFEQSPTLLAEVPPSEDLVYSDGQGGALAPQLYFVRAADTSGNESVDSPWAGSLGAVAQSGDLQGFDYYWVAPDRRAYLQMPNARAQDFVAEDTVILWRHLPEEENGRVKAAYEIDPVSADGAVSVSRFAFPSARTRITFLYTPASADVGAAPAPDVVFSPEDLAVFYHNGVELIKLGGAVDRADRSISVASRLSGKYVVQLSPRGTVFAVLQTVPRKIFTPNGDGVNDEFQIFFENPNDSMLSFAKVFDLMGAEVSDLKLGATENSLLWDGRGRSGSVEAGGIYIYQIQAEGKTWNGTCVLAK